MHHQSTAANRKQSKSITSLPENLFMPKIAVFGDIHSNLTALDAVLEECNRRKIDHFICLGDIVGYGPRPAECVAKIRALKCDTVLGNHDESVAHGDAHEGMNPLAAAGVRYSVEHLSDEARAWLRDLPFILKFPHAEAVHSSLVEPENWHYITDPQEARFSLKAQTEPVCFFGHTHRPALFSVATLPQPEELGEMMFRCDAAGRCMINPGAVGQPRARDPRAHFLIYDPAEMIAEFCRIEYDIEAEIQCIEQAGLPKVLGERLLLGL
jgi:predicted phosphodiesterase